MPTMNGLEATKVIKKMIRHSQQLSMTLKEKFNSKLDQEMCHVVAVTACVSDEAEQECLGVGMSRVYNKPIKAMQVEECVLRYIHKLPLEEIDRRMKLKAKLFTS